MGRDCHFCYLLLLSLGAAKRTSCSWCLSWTASSTPSPRSSGRTWTRKRSLTIWRLQQYYLKNSYLLGFRWSCWPWTRWLMGEWSLSVILNRLVLRNYFILTMIFLCPFLCHSFSVLFVFFSGGFKGGSESWWHSTGRTNCGTGWEWVQGFVVLIILFFWRQRGITHKNKQDWLVDYSVIFVCSRFYNPQRSSWSGPCWSDRSESWCAFTYRLFKLCPPIEHIDLVVVIH